MKKNNYFVDYFGDISEVNVQIVTESEGSGTSGLYTISGIFMQADKVNRNQRVYTKETLQRAVDEYQEVIKDGDAYGALDHPDNLDMKFSEASHIITKLELIGNDVYGEAVLIIDSPNAKQIINVLETKKKTNLPVRIGLSSRGAGRLVCRDNKNYVEDYKLIAVDLVCRPSAQSAYGAAVNESEYIYENGIIKKANFIKEDKFSEFLQTYSQTILKGN